jgi:uncharacterized protein YrrD
MPDPSSWLMIERGWRVVSADGEEIGHIDSVVGDQGTDIFDGLMVKSGTFGEAKYVPAEQVAGIVEGEVRLA